MRHEELSQDDIAILNSQSDETLIQWALDLNRWRWPEGLPDEETPEQYQAFMLREGGPGVIHSRRGAIMHWIEAKVSQKRILRAHNAGMTDEEFEDFWRGHYEGDPAALARDDARRHWAVRLALRPWQEVLCDESEFFDVFDVINCPR